MPLLTVPHLVKTQIYIFLIKSAVPHQPRGRALPPVPAPPPPSLPPLKGKVEEEEVLVEEIYVTSSSVIELDNCPSPAPTNTDGSDSGIYNASTDTGDTADIC